ncbi:MAG TPA: DUF998 domain-containing protein [Ktedonobacteraceae bacterium]
MQQVISKDGTSASPTTKLTRAVLACGIVAGPLWIVVVLIQMLIRPGFDLRYDEASLLSNGNLGWIQITNFVVTGLLVIACAVGMRRVLRGGRGRAWGSLLVGVYGLGTIGAGIFIADPMNGFPVGTPMGAPHIISWHGNLHVIAGMLGFLALIAGCFVFARRFAALKQRGWAAYSVATGVIFFAAVAGIAVGSQQQGAIQIFVNLAFFVAVVLGWAWVSAMAAKLLMEQRRTSA